jgi:hypothetical protein
LADGDAGEAVGVSPSACENDQACDQPARDGTRDNHRNQKKSLRVVFERTRRLSNFSTARDWCKTPRVRIAKWTVGERKI